MKQRRNEVEYNDKLDAGDQIDVEEWIAGVIYDEGLGEERSNDVGKQILKHVLLKFRPDLFGEG